MHCFNVTSSSVPIYRIKEETKTVSPKRTKSRPRKGIVLRTVLTTVQFFTELNSDIFLRFVFRHGLTLISRWKLKTYKRVRSVRLTLIKSCTLFLFPLDLSTKEVTKGGENFSFLYSVLGAMGSTTAHHRPKSAPSFHAYRILFIACTF